MLRSSQDSRGFHNPRTKHNPDSKRFRSPKTIPVDSRTQFSQTSAGLAKDRSASDNLTESDIDANSDDASWISVFDEGGDIDQNMCKSPFLDALFGTRTNQLTAGSLQTRNGSNGRRNSTDFQRSADFILNSDHGSDTNTVQSKSSASYDTERKFAHSRGLKQIRDQISVVSSLASDLTRPTKVQSAQEKPKTRMGNTAPLDQSDVASTTKVTCPNVEKLDEDSMIEVLIAGPEEKVSILCSRDVLKMRSTFFYDILHGYINKDLNTKGAQSIDASLSITSNNDVMSGYSPHVIYLEDRSPFECASFLVSLHDGKNLTSNGEWSFNWVRLAVQWNVDDLIVGFGAIIDSHIESVLSKIDNNNWRTNPDVLTGFRISIFRQTSSSMPTILTGTILDSPAHMHGGHNSLRICFDEAGYKQQGFKSPGRDHSSKITSRVQSYSRTFHSIRKTDEPLFDSAKDDASGSLSWSDFSAPNSDEAMPPTPVTNPGTITLDIKDPIW
jgi:hypothetical protein